MGGTGSRVQPPAGRSGLGPIGSLRVNTSTGAVRSLSLHESGGGAPFSASDLRTALTAASMPMGGRRVGGAPSGPGSLSAPPPMEAFQVCALKSGGGVGGKVSLGEPGGDQRHRTPLSLLLILLSHLACPGRMGVYMSVHNFQSPSLQLFPCHTCCAAHSRERGGRDPASGPNTRSGGPPRGAHKLTAIALPPPSSLRRGAAPRPLPGPAARARAASCTAVAPAAASCSPPAPSPPAPAGEGASSPAPPPPTRRPPASSRRIAAARLRAGCAPPRPTASSRRRPRQQRATGRRCGRPSPTRAPPP